MTQTAAGEGLDFRFDIARAGNTFDGHRLVHLAKAHGLQDAMKERLLHAYFSEGELDLRPRDAGPAGAGGRPARRRGARDAGGDRYAADVREDEAHGAQLRHQRRADLRGRPQARRVGRPAARALLGLLRQGWDSAAARSAIVSGPDGEACGVDGC